MVNIMAVKHELETSETCEEAVTEVRRQGDQGLDHVGGSKKGDRGMLYGGRIKKKLESGKKRMKEREESKNFQPDSVRLCHY